jgi:hypothetical protein
VATEPELKPGIMPLDFCNGNQDDDDPSQGHSMPVQNFSYGQRLSVWRDYRLEMHCCRCEQRTTSIEVKGLIRWHGDRTFAEILSRLRCMFCRQRPTFVSLCSGTAGDAAVKHSASWSLVLTADNITG